MLVVVAAPGNFILGL